jgi:hypothetical protein
MRNPYETRDGQRTLEDPGVHSSITLINIKGTRGNAKKGKTQREMDRWSKTEHDKTWTDRRGY